MLLKSRLLTTLLFVVAEALPSQEHISNDLSSISHESSVTWTGRIEEDGEVMSFTGLGLQDIEAQIREIRPGFSWSRMIEPGSRDPGDILCDISWNPPFASVFHIRQGIAYLHKIQGDCTNGPGPGNCSRVSCSYGSGIWFCNDNRHPMSVPCSAFGDRAWDIVEKCYAYGDFPTDSVHGQAFDAAGWNVIVAGADC
ncbi:hypothetical protein GGS24DRAFT_503943 [Hypoxylon argillaceum]|nr:hypothetical protein GGS24DRAFT_503943 [Hypoxylon argillaceum]KAI1154812.1 hypothetical protein F4825DRAFT_448057 [Nemania diffusa]